MLGKLSCYIKSVLFYSQGTGKTFIQTAEYYHRTTMPQETNTTTYMTLNINFTILLFRL